MTTYNGEKYILGQLRSIFAQTRQPDDVIICDDGSTDATTAIISEFIKANALDNWHLSVNEKNLGYIKNFCHAISQTTGSIIFLCDQDDIWYHDKIAELTGRILEDDRIKVLNSSFQKIDANGEPIRSRTRFGRSNNNLILKRLRPEEMRFFHFESIIWRNISPGCTLALTGEIRDFFLTHHTDLCPHDWEINIFGAANNGVYFLNEPLMGYRIHESNTIGLADIKLSDRLSANASDKRLALAEQEYLRAEAYKSAPWTKLLVDGQRKALNRYHRTTLRRFEAVKAKSFGKWLRLLLHPKDYFQLRGPQGMLNDLYAVLHKSSENA